MKKMFTLLITCLISSSTFGQGSGKISTMDFIQIQKGYKAEALFFYRNNWKELREEAENNGYIDSFLLLETRATEDAPFHIVLITTYSNNEQYQEREDNFAELMEGSTGPKLLNNVSPKVFRKKLFSKQKALSIN